MHLTFTKMHGLGNDFVLLDRLDDPWLPNPAQSRHLADRRLGIGCDQVVVLLPAPDDLGDLAMRIFNPDGSEAEMCGNAARCVALYLVTRRGFAAPSIRLSTLAGLITLTPAADHQVEVDMGPPRFAGAEIPALWDGPVIDQELTSGHRTYRITALSMGNPHCVLFTDRAEEFPLEEEGAALSEHPRFPNRVNVEIAQVLSRDRLRVRVWERGAGITPACGTGACAAAVAAMTRGLLDRRASVLLDGGALVIRWEEGRVFMRGPATFVFQGSLEID